MTIVESSTAQEYCHDLCTMLWDLIFQLIDFLGQFFYLHYLHLFSETQPTKNTIQGVTCSSGVVIITHSLTNCTSVVTLTLPLAEVSELSVFLTVVLRFHQNINEVIQLPPSQMHLVPNDTCYLVLQS